MCLTLRLEAKLAEVTIERITRDSKLFRRFLLISTAALECADAHGPSNFVGDFPQGPALGELRRYCGLFNFALRGREPDIKIPAVPKYGSPFQDIPQFPDISRPLVLGQGFHRGGIHQGNIAKLHVRGQARKDLFGKDGYVLHSIPKRRDSERDHVKSEKQVLSKASGINFFFQVSVRSCDETGVNRDTPFSSNPCELPRV